MINLDSILDSFYPVPHIQANTMSQTVLPSKYLNALSLLSLEQTTRAVHLLLELTIISSQLNCSNHLLKDSSHTNEVNYINTPH